MAEVFTTNIQNIVKSERILKLPENNFPALKFNFDLKDFKSPYLCNQTILRVESKLIRLENVINTINPFVYHCNISEYMVCN